MPSGTPILGRRTVKGGRCETRVARIACGTPIPQWGVGCRRETAYPTQSLRSTVNWLMARRTAVGNAQQICHDFSQPKGGASGFGENLQNPLVKTCVFLIGFPYGWPRRRPPGANSWGYGTAVKHHIRRGR